MNEQQRLEAFKQALGVVSAQYGVRLAIVQQMGHVVLDEPALGYVLMAERTTEEEDGANDQNEAARLFSKVKNAIERNV